MFTIGGYELGTDSLCDNYKLLDELDICPLYGESGTDEIPNVKVCIYRCPTECTLEEAELAIIDKYFGTMSIETQEYGYSEYTIEGFYVDECKIGNHDLDNILYDKQNRYTILTIERVKD